jgi:hypothetical protein
VRHFGGSKRESQSFDMSGGKAGHTPTDCEFLPKEFLKKLVVKHQSFPYRSPQMHRFVRWVNGFLPVSALERKQQHRRRN